MKKARILEIAALALILLTSIPVFILVNIFSSHVLYASYIVVLVYLTMVMPIAYYLTDFIVELKVSNYKSHQYVAFNTLLIEIIGVAIYLILVNFVKAKNFNSIQILFWILIPFAIIIPSVISYILGKKKPKKNGPNLVRRR